jgi:LuxR family quorum sensing-dependent transcriptional regulator
MLTRDRPFGWSDIAKSRPLTERELHIMNEAREYGGHDGFVTPIRNLDGSMGNVTLFARKCDLSEDARTALHIMSLYFGGAAHRLQQGERSAPVKLPDRERDIVAYLARGFTQAEIAEKLDLSPRTVETLVQRSRSRFGVTTTAQLCVEAVRQGAIQL